MNRLKQGITKNCSWFRLWRVKTLRMCNKTSLRNKQKIKIQILIIHEIFLFRLGFTQNKNHLQNLTCDANKGCLKMCILLSNLIHERVVSWAKGKTPKILNSTLFWKIIILLAIGRCSVPQNAQNKTWGNQLCEMRINALKTFFFNVEWSSVPCER